HSLARAVARAVKRQAQVTQGVQNVYDDEDYLLALILKDKLEETECKKKLKEYCKGLRTINPGLDKVDEKLQKVCKEDKTAEKKCTGLKEKIKAKCTVFMNELKTESGKSISKLKDNDCKNNEQKCLFLEGACSDDLKEKCNDLRNKCYQKKRDEVAEKALLRALNGDLKDKDLCKKKIENVCLLLGQESNELMQKCFDTESLCTSLVQTIKDKCASLKTEIGKVLTTDGKLQKKEHSLLEKLLEKCHFHYESCKTENPDCNNLKKKCKDAGITYIPPGLKFDPTKPEATLAEKIGLEELYKEAARQGVVIQRALERDIVDLLVFLSGSNPFDDTQCQSVLNTKCSSIEYLTQGLKDLCGNKSNYTKKCKEFKEEFQETKDSLEVKFRSNLFEKEIKLWGELPKFLTENDCVGLQSDCFYFEGQTDFEKICKNVKAACYKKGLDALANQALQDKMRGKFHNRNDTWFETLQKDLVKTCVDLKGESDELFVLCVKPTEGALTVLTDLHTRTNLLQGDLNERRDFPTRQDCEELLKKCQDLEQDSEEIKWPCRTLKHHCNRLEIAEQLEERLLEEKVKDLDKFDLCLENLGKRCHEWSKRGRTRFALACVAQNITCKILTKSVESKCTTLKARMKTNGVLDKAKEEKTMEETCDSWTPYCSKFMSSCQSLIAGDGKCKELNKECETFIKKKELELKVVDQLKGHLNTRKKCKGELDKYCTQWANASNGLETLCTDTTNSKNDTEVRKKLCEKLVEQVKSQCPELQKKLAETSKELEKKANEYEDIKKKAKDAMEKANLVLSKAKVENNKSANEVVPSAPAVPSGTKDTKLFRLIRRDATVKVTEDEAKAFDLVAQAFGLYVELREICHDLLKGCGFKKECDCDDLCKTIESKCHGLKPLDVKPYEITTKNITTTTTTTTTTTETVKDAKATECQSLQTTDTWVTKTSTHTSTSTTTSTVTSRITLTSTRRCKPTKCTTGDDPEDVKPSEGLRMNGWSIMKGMIVAMMISFMI
ncbi:uncharacterized protein T551_03713, partial [Pneumocystis jirovecii RU7]